MRQLTYILPILFISLFFSCGSSDSTAYLPKPRGYHRLEMPDHSYQKDAFKDKAFKGYPYTFEVAKNAEIVPDESFMSEPYWIEVQYPEFKATVDISYKKLANYDSLVGYTNTSNVLTFKHNVRATAIDEYTTRTNKGYTAVLYEIEGDVPSQFQFFVTDSTEHFFRAALYFPSSTQNDSLAPVIDYVKEDMMHMLNTLEWQ
ncbi:gliding motility lipoprotein GldD [Flammeovirga yaeyamensis]|uniref:Gliding motility lipoprotein GldD n=1 Tax=Flammeovirga yaeyamensis TaxID=367791 RepID=A0AAX1N3S4_9BACT|nr:gliding motility lipoprotein GldD [Flammeovirga yaeyamensis]MBB3699613.1 gliding motility-associated lipoprotein GldD [Flammeovirga yaeyamensis]NMF36814.1 gliding motility lipoprotein GldD [Flammeovirga yaeyamensis]QWG02146.1 gliding motility lipoprotein GldD [Flammeovirga yaeyamensis]